MFEPFPPAGERLIRALYGQAQALPASLFNLGISPYINASIVVTVLLVLPAEIFTFQWLARLKEARKEGKSVSGEGLCKVLAKLISMGGEIIGCAMHHYPPAPPPLYAG